MKSRFRKNTMNTFVLMALGAMSGTAYAAGFALIEQNASGMGNAYAGASAVAEDASTVFFNPAGMSRLEGKQFAAAGHVIMLSAEFSGTGTRPVALGGPANTGGTGGDAGGTSVVPNGYFVMPLNDKMSFGVGLNVPFGLATKYEDSWQGRFQGINSDLQTVNINPAMSYKISEAVSVGAGINYQKLEVELTNASIAGPGVEGRTKLVADDDTWGWNIGMLFQVGIGTRVGVSYRSKMDYKLNGDVTTTVLATGAAVPQGTFSANAEVTLPDMISVSVVHSLSDDVQLLADLTSTRWSEIDQVLVKDSAGATRDALVLNFDDAMRYSVGVNFKWNDQWTLKGGLAIDESPVKSAQDRTVRLPDNDRTWISLGGQRKLGSSSRLDLGYTHIFIKDADINFTRAQLGLPAPVASSTVTGSYKGSVDILSIQYTMNF
ncbi:MAG: OmpP1/FadL family transporter [Burkholderiales bacterium]